ncbi:GTPase Era, partial [bacterium]|nr:GTPase Era [bacterium]
MNTESSGGFKVGYAAIVGRPNVGKSTLLNNLLDFKVSAVTRKPQTTRHQVRGILNGETHQIVFLDTPGILQPKYKLQEAMLKNVYRAVQDADLVLFMIEASSMPKPDDGRFLDPIMQSSKQLILAINKIDTLSKDQILPLMEHFGRIEKIKSVIPISALKADGLDELVCAIADSLPEGQPLYPLDLITDHPERFIAAEIIRETIFRRFGQEVPYAITVNIEEFRERPQG